MVDGWTGGQSRNLMVESSTQTSSTFGGIDAGLQTVDKEIEEKFMQTWSEEMYDIECQTEVVTSGDIGVQTSGYQLKEESQDTFETANEEEFWQMKVTQTDVRAMTNRLVQTLLTSTFKHEGQKEKKKKGAPKGDVSQYLEEGQKEQLSKRKTSGEIRASDLEIAKRAELKQAFHLEDDEKDLLLHELKALRAQKQAEKAERKIKARERLQNKPVPVVEKEYESSSEEEGEDIDEKVQLYDGQGVEDRFDTHGQDDSEESVEDEDVEDFTANANTQTEWLDTHILDQLSEVPLQRLHRILPHLLYDKQIYHEFTQTDWSPQEQQKEEQAVDNLARMSADLEDISAKAIVPKATSFSSQFKQTIPSATHARPSRIRRQASSLGKPPSIEAEEEQKKRSTGKFKGSKIERLVSKFEHIPEDSRIIGEHAQTHLTATSAQIFSPNLSRQTSIRRGEVSMFTQRENTLSTTQPLLQPTPPLFLKRPDAITASEYAEKLRLPSEQALLPTTSIPTTTTPLIHISHAQPSHGHPIHPRSSCLSLHRHPVNCRPTCCIQSACPTTNVHTQPSPAISTPLYDGRGGPVSTSSSNPSPTGAAIHIQPSSIPNTPARIPTTAEFVHPPSNPSIQLKRSSSGTFVPVFKPLQDIMPYMEAGHLEEEAIIPYQSVLGHIVELADGEIQFLPIDSSFPIPENSHLRGQEPSGEVAIKILGEINQLIVSGVLPIPMRRRRSRVPDLLQARIHFLEELSRREVAFGDVSLRDTSHVDRRPSFSGWKRRELEDRNEQLIGWRRNSESRKDRMLEVGIQTGVQARVQHLLGGIGRKKSWFCHLFNPPEKCH
uniref:Uncharacterized protein n=1 Tax=Ditylenchus dipsaci TaxID=166011 RepID=A0A915DQZ1_9BILA